MYPWISRTLDFWLQFCEKKVRLIHGRLWYLDSKLKKGQHSRACSQVRLFCCAFGRFKDVTVSLLLPPFFDWTIRHKWPAAISSFSGFVVRHWYFGPAVCLFDAKIDANLPNRYNLSSNIVSFFLPQVIFLQ